MAKALKGIYNRRHPERTDYYRIIEGSFEEFERTYPDQFEEKYGYLRTEVMKALYSFLDCGILILRTIPLPFMRERIGPLPACMQPTPLWNSWRCSQVIFHPLMKVSYIITVSIAAHIEVKSVEKTGMIRVSRYKRQKAPAEQVPHGPA